MQLVFAMPFLRLGHWFDVGPEFWINLQAQFELVTASKETGDAIRKLPMKVTMPTRRAAKAGLGSGALWHVKQNRLFCFRVFISQADLTNLRG